MKRLMPFVQVIREKIQLVGLNAFNLTLDFDEFKVLQDNKKYLENTLDLENIVIKYTNEAPEKTREECCPGAPYMNFFVKLGIPVFIINPQKYNGLFRMTIKIANADTVENIISRISKDSKLIKNSSLISLYRYNDPLLGPRNKPTTENILKGQ